MLLPALLVSVLLPSNPTCDVGLDLDSFRVSAWQQDGLGSAKPRKSQNQVSVEELAEWYEKAEAPFEDEVARKRGREILDRSLEFHGWKRFLEVGGLKLKSGFVEILVQNDGTEQPMLRGYGEIYLMPDHKGIYASVRPGGQNMRRAIPVRAVHDGELSWIHDGGRDNRANDVAKSAWNYVQRHRYLCGLPFAFKDPGVEVAYIGEGEVAVLRGDEAVAAKTWRVRVRLGQDAGLGLWTFNKRPEPVRILNFEVFQDTHQLAAIDYLMFRSGRLTNELYFEYRHEFSKDDFLDDTYKIPNLRLTTLSRDGRRGREFRITAVEEGPAPKAFMVRGWEVLEGLPTIPGENDE